MLPTTSGQIAKDVGADRDTVSYALRKIKAEPVGRAGIVRLFPPGTTDAVRDYLKNRKQRKERTP